MSRKKQVHTVRSRQKQKTFRTLLSSERLEDRCMLTASADWTPLGPFSATNGQVENIANKPVAGAIHALLAHPTNPNTLYVGSVNGGVWKSLDATVSQPHWTPLTDSMPSQSISALAFDSADANSNTIYAGVGRNSSLGRIGNQRIGLMRSINAGQNWQVVDGGGVLQGKNISGVYANGNTIVVSVNVADNSTYANIGIFRSTNGGTSFTQISTGASTGLPGGVSYDLVAEPLNSSVLYTSVVFSPTAGGNGVYKSSNAGANWTKVSTPAMDALIVANTSNLEMAAGRNNEVYAGIINAGALAGLFRSPDNGLTWASMDLPQTNETGGNVGLNPRGGKGPTSGPSELIAGGQGNIHFSIVADPNNANLVYVGGDRQPMGFQDRGSFPNAIGANDYSGRLFRGDASKPAGSQFVHLTHKNNLGAAGGGTASNSSPHADSRDMTFDANGNLIEVDDGGVYRRTSPKNNTGDWFSVIGDLQVTEAHDVAWDSLSNVAMTGNQDTGSTYQPSANAKQWVSLTTGDGGDIAIDNIQLAGSNQSVRYSSYQYLNVFQRTVWDSSGGLVSASFPALAPTAGSSAIVGAFRTPVETNSVAGGRLLIQGSNSLYESLDAGTTVTAIGVNRGNSSIFSNAIWYGGTQNNVANPDLVWAASGSDVFLRTSGTGSVTQTDGDPTTDEIRDLAVNSRDWANAFVIDDNQVFQSTNSGNTWGDITGNLLTLVSDLRSISFVASEFGNYILAGTNLGVFAAAISALGTWSKLGSSLPNAIVFDMEYDVSDDILVVGTMGRGAWSLTNVNSVLDPTLKLLSVSPSGTVLPPSSVSQITVRFSEEALGASVVKGNFLLVGDGDDGEFGSETAPGDDVSISISDSQISQALDGSQGVVTISFSSPLLPDRYRLTLKGTGSNPLRNGAGLPLSNGKDLSSMFLIRANAEEPNDWMDNAINVSRTSGRIVFDENLGDGAYGSRDVDMFKVTLAQSQLFIADIDALRLSKTSLFNSYLRLFDSKGNQILANNDFAESADSYLEFRAKEAGTYYVGVSGYGNSSYLAVNGFGRPGSTGDYRLSLTFQTVAATPSPLTLTIVNITPNPRTEAVPEIVLEFNRPASGFDIGDLGLTRNNQTVSLVGTTLVSSDNKRWILTGLSTKTSDSGAYSFTVNVGGSGIQDQFGLMLSSNVSKSWIMSGPVVPPPPPSLSVDFGDAIPDSYNVIFASNSNIQTKLLSQKIGDGPNKSKDVDILKFTLSVGSRLDIDVNARSLSIPSKLDSFVRLFDSTGKQLAYNDNDRRIGKTSPDSFLTFEVKTAGVYYVGISGSGNAGYNPAKPVSGKSGSLGDYTVEISVSSAAMTSPQASVLQSMAFSLWQASQSTSSSTPKATRLTF